MFEQFTGSSNLVGKPIADVSDRLADVIEQTRVAEQPVTVDLEYNATLILKVLANRIVSGVSSNVKPNAII